MRKPEDHAPPDPQPVDQYRVLFERSADAILIIDGDTFIDCNDATVRMLRYRNKEELLQTHPSELSPEFQPDGRRSFEKANEMIAAAFEKGSHRFEWNHQRADGEVFPVEVLLTAVPEGEKFLLHVVWRDITERKRLEDELRHAQKMEAIGKLAGGIAHDFNNLLVAILGYADLLGVELEGQPQLEEHVQQIIRAGSRAAELTSQLLAFGRKQVLEPEVIDLGVVVEDLEKMLRLLVGAHVEFHIERDAAPTLVRADPGQIEQMILNIASNARDAMPERGTLILRTSRVVIDETSDLDLPAGAYGCMTVTDSGCGMSAKVQSRAFDPFFTTKERGRGTGLGLSSVYGTVKQSGGDVRLTSEPGVGTTIVVYLPLTAVATPAAVERAPAQEDRQRHGKETVLVVEDEPAVAGLVRRILEEQGYTVFESADGAAALRAFSGSARRIDFVLTDVVMPHMSGPELVRRLRKERRDLPVMFMSGYTDDALAEHGFRMGDLELLRKPFTPAQLVARVERFLQELSNHG